MIDLNTALIGLVAVILIIQRWREQDVLEQIRVATSEVRRDEQNRCKLQIEQGFRIYQRAVREGFDAHHYTETHRDEEDES